MGGCVCACVCFLRGGGGGSQGGAAEPELSQCAYKPQGANTHQQILPHTYKYRHTLTKYKSEKLTWHPFKRTARYIPYRPQHCHSAPPHTHTHTECRARARTPEYLTPCSALESQRKHTSVHTVGAQNSTPAIRRAARL